jgi:hypothetical protein
VVVTILILFREAKSCLQPWAYLSTDDGRTALSLLVRIGRWCIVYCYVADLTLVNQYNEHLAVGKMI